MNLKPNLSSFLRTAAPGSRVPVWCEFLFDTDTAVTAYSKLKEGPFGFLLESVVGGEQWARYSFLGSRPQSVWKLEGSGLSVWRSGRGWKQIDTKDPMADLTRRLSRAGPCADPRLPRFWGGAVGYFGYDMARRFERLGPGPADDQGFPEALVMFTDVVVAIDNLNGRTKAITTVETGASPSAKTLERAYRDAVRRLEDTVHRLRFGTAPDPLAFALDTVADPASDPASDPAPDPAALVSPTASRRKSATPLPYASNFARDEFLAGVRKIKEYIAAGDAFQVVLSQRLSVPFAGPPFRLYRAIRTINPSPYLFHLDLDDFSIVGSSPEVMVRLEDGVVTVRPIAGTRRRGRSAQEDAQLADELARDEKELAEHRMLVDLGRNDVGRVSEYGSVTVPELMKVERYSHVMHLCSQVEGRVRKGVSALDVLGACFPAGTVSGAPKLRAMEIIDELEPTARGPYAGAVGHIGWGAAQTDTAIAIRTMVVKDGVASVQAGAGVVADSDPESEYQETLNKARALLRAAAVAGPS